MARKKKNKKSGKKDIRQLNENTFFRTVLDIFSHNPFYHYDFEQISKSLGIHDKASKTLVSNILIDLEASNAIVQTKPGKYKLNEEYLSQENVTGLIAGTVDMKRTGKAYIIPDEGGEDIFVAANNTAKALDGDKVLVRLFPQRGKKREGQIVEITKRVRQSFVGVLQVTKKFAFLIPDDTSLPMDIFIPKSLLKGGKDGEKAIAKITDWPERSNNPFGEITEVLGVPGDNDVEMNSILANFDFPIGFPDLVEKEADSIPEKISQKEIDLRRDFRGTPTLTIDPADAKDFDDALSIQKLSNGNFEIGVHIADVSHYVKKGTKLDKEAYKRATSVYLVDRVIPMLPEKLSNKVCSLRPHEEKLCFTAVFEMNEKAEVLKEWFGKTIINSDHRFTYEEAQKIIEGEDGPMMDEVLQLHDLATIMRDKRFNTGAIAFNSEEVKFILDETGHPIDTYVKVTKEANWLIEEFMLLANRRVAESVGKVTVKNKEAKTFVYRIHDDPDPAKLQNFSEFVGKLGYKLKSTSRKTLASSLNKLFEEIAGKGEQSMIETIAIRTMAKAVYSTTNVGHYGLGFDHYSHFTSPIRRYPDLMVHRLLEHYLEGGKSADAAKYEEYCDHSSDMERRAIDAERMSVKYKQAEYLADKIGHEFGGLISGVSKWGLFVELDNNKCEGLVSIHNLDDDYYYLDEENYQIIGRNYGKKYRLGDRVNIIVKAIDLQKKQMDFEIIEN